MEKNMLVIPSVPSKINEVESFLNRINRKLKISQEKYPAILISLTEAVNNAIIHGNKGDQQKKVKICYKKDKANLRFTISDEGNGFRPEEIPDPTKPENLECCGGRGVLIMTSLCDGVEYQDNGSTVSLSFELDK